MTHNGEQPRIAVGSSKEPWEVTMMGWPEVPDVVIGHEMARVVEERGDRQPICEGRRDVNATRSRGVVNHVRRTTNCGANGTSE